MGSDKKINIEVVYATATQSYLLSVAVPVSSTIAQGIETSGILEQCPEIKLDQNKVGIFSKLKSLDDKLNEGDRIEIYRPLKIDPKEARRRRV
jgi:putative ubiquitin-RnfH superfamily antitoxin RatB of RatAB toxin-antitoxin module